MVEIFGEEKEALAESSRYIQEYLEKDTLAVTRAILESAKTFQTGFHELESKEAELTEEFEASDEKRQEIREAREERREARAAERAARKAAKAKEKAAKKE